MNAVDPIEPKDDDIADEMWGIEDDEPTDNIEDFEVPDDLETHQL